MLSGPGAVRFLTVLPLLFDRWQPPCASPSLANSVPRCSVSILGNTTCTGSVCTSCTQGADGPQSLILDSLHVPDRVSSALTLSAFLLVPSIQALLTPQLLPIRVVSLSSSVLPQPTATATLELVVTSIQPTLRHITRKVIYPLHTPPQLPVFLLFSLRLLLILYPLLSPPAFITQSSLLVLSFMNFDCYKYLILACPAPGSFLTVFKCLLKHMHTLL